jgi:hypothetical protein
MKSKYSRVLVLMIIALLSLSACGGSESDAISSTAKEWLQALFTGDGNTLSRTTCSAFANEVGTSALLMTAANGMFGSALGLDTTLDVNLDNATFTVTQSNSNSATVKLGGEVTISISGFFQSAPVVATFEMGKESGSWKVCNYIDGR